MSESLRNDGRIWVPKEKEDAEKIRKEKLPPTGVIGALPDKISPVIAVSILEQASGNQAVILRELFD